MFYIGSIVRHSLELLRVWLSTSVLLLLIMVVFTARTIVGGGYVNNSSYPLLLDSIVRGYLIYSSALMLYALWRPSVIAHHEPVFILSITTRHYVIVFPSSTYTITRLVSICCWNCFRNILCSSREFVHQSLVTSFWFCRMSSVIVYLYLAIMYDFIQLESYDGTLWILYLLFYSDGFYNVICLAKFSCSVWTTTCTLGSLHFYMVWYIFLVTICLYRTLDCIKWKR
jgi:hypothetical protein